MTTRTLRVVSKPIHLLVSDEDVGGAVYCGAPPAHTWKAPLATWKSLDSARRCRSCARMRRNELNAQHEAETLGW